MLPKTSSLVLFVCKYWFSGFCWYCYLYKLNMVTFSELVWISCYKRGSSLSFTIWPHALIKYVITIQFPFGVMICFLIYYYKCIFNAVSSTSVLVLVVILYYYIAFYCDLYSYNTLNSVFITFFNIFDFPY